MSEKLRVIVFKDGDLWLAQGIEHDICVQATTLPALKDRFDLAVQAQPDLSKIPAAPAQFQAMWDNRGGDLTPVSDKEDPFSYGIAA
jgi:hypothetical protein